jgi:hypothetical protein
MTASATAKLSCDKRKTPYNSTYPKGGVSCSKDSLLVNGSLVFQIKFCGKSPALRVAANRYLQAEKKNPPPGQAHLFFANPKSQRIKK